MSHFFFSIIIPTYNSAKTISRTLDSVLYQTDNDFEIVIIDDNSDDKVELKKNIEFYKGKGLVINIHLSNVKLNGAGARNKGIDLACGKYVCFLDSDDEWSHEKLEETRRSILDLESKGVDKYIVYSKVNIFEDGKFLKTMPVLQQGKYESIAEYLFGCYGFIQTSSITLKRSDAMEIKFNNGFIRHQDFDFCIRADKKGFKFFLLDKALVNYHMVSNAGAKHKGESSAYSYFWLKEMSEYLSKKDVFTYKAFKLPLRYQMDGDLLCSFLIFGLYFSLTSNRNKFYFIKRLFFKMMSKFKLN